LTVRDTNLEKLGQIDFDVLVVGGGINGAVTAAALSARGAKVALIDRGDWAGVTSQASSNLAWGGIKYLQTFELGLVRKLCRSRNRLMAAYPSIVQEIRFYTSLDRKLSLSPFLLFLATILYWFLGSCFTRPPRLLTRRRIAREEPVIDIAQSKGGVEYSDCYLVDNDARLVFRFVRSALNYGCIAANYVESLGGSWNGNRWHIRARDKIEGRELLIRARVLVNACGPYVDHHNQLTGQRTAHRHAFSKGIHLIVPQITPVRRVLTFFADDGRPFFAIPMYARTDIGTTDTRVPTPETEVTPEDRRFVLENINKRLRLSVPLRESDVIAERCGVRPLVVPAGSEGASGDWTKLSRKHVVEVNPIQRHVSIFGGKLTDCLNVGDEVSAAVRDLGVALPYRRRRWYGEPPAEEREEFFHQARLMGLDDLTSPGASEPLSTRLWRRYGSLAFSMLEEIRRDPGAAEVLIETSEYIRCEITQAAHHEMITKLEDFLRRRSKISQVVPHEDLRRSPGLKEACRILFGKEAPARWEEYFQEPWSD
jgi:glycerol-3-phosphate dehydrogenase